MSSSALHACPLCDAIPTITRRWRFQVRCGCGACGPKRANREEAISRWASVVHYIGKLRQSLAAGPQAESQAA